MACLRFFGHAGGKPCPGLEHPDHAANRPARRRLGLTVHVPIDQPVAEPVRPERIDLESIADRNLGAQAAIGRAKQLRARGKPGQNLQKKTGAETRPSCPTTIGPGFRPEA